MTGRATDRRVIGCRPDADYLADPRWPAVTAAAAAALAATVIDGIGFWPPDES